jgi:hypothetical protein
MNAQHSLTFLKFVRMHSLQNVCEHGITETGAYRNSQQIGQRISCSNSLRELFRGSVASRGEDTQTSSSSTAAANSWTDDDIMFRLSCVPTVVSKRG